MTSRSERMPATLSPSITGIAPILRSASEAMASRTLAPAEIETTSRPLRSRIRAMVMGLGLLFSRLALNHGPGAAQMEAMPRHDPIPPRPGDAQRDPRDLERAHRAWLHYRKTMRWMVLVSVAAALLAIFYLWVTGTPMRLHLVIATLAGVFLSVLLGTGLMGLVFPSNRSGADDAATAKERKP